MKIPKFTGGEWIVLIGAAIATAVQIYEMIFLNP